MVKTNALRIERGGEVGVGNISDLPGRKHKSSQLLALPAVTEFMEKVKSSSLAAGEMVHVTLSPEKMTQLKITTPGRIIKEIVQTMIESEGIKSKRGERLDVQKFKADDGAEVVYVAAPVLGVGIRRASSIERTKKRHRGEK
jgi:hypothetical protein